MDRPNLYTLTEPSGTYGIHEFRDSVVFLCKQHSSGDWITIRPATANEVNYMEDHGEKTEKSRRGRLL